MNTAIMPMPGALRWRALHPLIDEGGACSLIYDLERATVLEVPEELQLHVAPALETGDPDDDLLSWLVGEDLITMEGWVGWDPERGLIAPTDDWGAVLRMEDEAHVRVTEATGDAALQAVEVGFRQGLGAARVQVHLDWDGVFAGSPGTGSAGTGALERIVLVARRLALEAGQEVAFDLTLSAGQVTPAVASFLSSLPVHVRLLCGEFPGGEASLSRETRHALLLLWMEDLPERVTLCFSLSGEVRLKEVWAWARRLGVRHLDVTRQPGPSDTDETQDACLRDLRADLQEVLLEVSACLEDRSVPVDFRPLTRVVRRLMHAEPLARFRDDRLGEWPVGDVPFPRPDADPVISKPLEAIELETGSSCAGCWARYLCRNSALLVNGADAEERTRGTCAAWRVEAEAALRLYHRLAQADPLQVLRVFGESSGLPDDLPTVRVTESWSTKAPC